MAPIRGTSVRLLIDEFDFSSATNRVTVTKTVPLLDPTNLESTGIEKLPGLPDGNIEHSGFHTGAGAGELQHELRARLGSSTPAIIALTLGTAAGSPADVLPTTWAGQMTVNAPVNELITLEGMWPANGGFKSGLLIFRGDLDEEDANEASVDFGAAGSNGGVAYLFVQDIDGSMNGDAVVKVRSSSTQNGTYADKATFQFNQVGAYAAAMSGTVNRWIQVYTDDLGGADAITVACIVGVKGINY